MTDLRPTILAKSDQLNADDLIAGPITIKITDVRLLEAADQPVAIHWEGGEGRPFKPCKSMRRVMVKVWGENGRAFIGQRMTLYRDDKVRFGADAVGGIRISHMSGLDRDVELALMVTRGKRAPYRVKPLPAEERARQTPAESDFPGDRSPSRSFTADEPDEFDVDGWARGLINNPDAFATVADVDAFFSDKEAEARFNRLQDESPPLAKELMAALRGRKKALADRERTS